MNAENGRAKATGWRPHVKARLANTRTARTRPHATLERVLKHLQIGLGFSLFLACSGGDEVTLHPAHCRMPSNRVGVCGTGLTPLERTTFRVFSERQEVMRWATAGGPPERFTNCVVRDRHNWSCPDPTGAFVSFGMVDGVFRSDVHTPPAATDSVIYLNTFEWWLNKAL
jgi:hypothetical protein